MLAGWAPPPPCLRLDQLRWRLSALALQGVTGLCDGHMTSDQSFLNAPQALSLLGHTTPDLGMRNDNTELVYFVFCKKCSHILIPPWFWWNRYIPRPHLSRLASSVGELLDVITHMDQPLASCETPQLHVEKLSYPQQMWGFSTQQQTNVYLHIFVGATCFDART